MKKYLILIAIFSIPYLPLFPSGLQDYREYQAELSQQFPAVVDSLAKGEITSTEAKDKLGEIRAAYNMSYTDESGIIDSFLDQLGEGEITKESALLYFSYLKDKRIPELRREEGNSSALSYQKELLETYSEVISNLSANMTSIEEAILNMETFQRNSGFLRNRMFVKLQTLLLTYQTGSITDNQLRSRYTAIKNSWKDSIEENKSGGSSSDRQGDDDDNEVDDDDDNDDNDDDNDDDDDDDDDSDDDDDDPDDD